MQSLLAQDALVLSKLGSGRGQEITPKNGLALMVLHTTCFAQIPKEHDDKSKREKSVGPV